MSLVVDPRLQQRVLNIVCTSEVARGGRRKGALKRLGCASLQVGRVGGEVREVRFDEPLELAQLAGRDLGSERAEAWSQSASVSTRKGQQHLR